MILPKSHRLTPEQLSEVTGIVTEFGCQIQPIIGAVRTIYAIVGDERDELMINRLEGLGYIERIDRIQSPFKLMDRRSDLATSTNSATRPKPSWQSNLPARTSFCCARTASS